MFTGINLGGPDSFDLDVAHYQDVVGSGDPTSHDRVLPGSIRTLAFIWLSELKKGSLSGALGV